MLNIKLRMGLLTGPALACLILLGACRDKDKTTETVNAAAMKVYPAHHGNPVDSVTVYIKANATEKPQVFDDSARCVLVNGVPVATFNNLSGGTYYVYGFGYDPKVAQNVKGGQTVSVTENTTYTVNLAISE